MPSMNKIMSDNPILLVEDNFIFAKIIQEVLTEAGLIVRYAEDGLATWKLLEEGEKTGGFSAILLDRLMPSIDGIELLGKIKATLVFEQLPVIMVTATSYWRTLLPMLALNLRRLSLVCVNYEYG